MRIYLANVGANTSQEHRGLISPLFDDGTFEFLPIPEGDRNLDTHMSAVHYRDLRSRSEPNRDLLPYVPERLWSAACHNDPEFETLTYGDTGKGSAANLNHMKIGDVLLFIARLVPQAGDKAPGFYLVGGLSVDSVVGSVTQPLTEQAAQRFSKNAHVVRALCTGVWDGFWVFGGSSRSRRFERAVPVTREICEKVFRDASGEPWDWSRQTETATIGSYTRARRCMLDTTDPNQAERSAALQAWIAQHSSETDAELLD